MIETVYVYYTLRNVPVVLGVDRSGILVSLFVNGQDFARNRLMEHEVTKALRENGIDLQRDLKTAFERAHRAYLPRNRRLAQ